MRLQFIMTTMILGFISQPGAVLAASPTTHCETPDRAKYPCTTLVINYAQNANYAIATTYESCETGETVTVRSTANALGGDCPTNNRLGPYTYRDVRVDSDLLMGPVGTAIKTYNETNTKAKAGTNTFLCSGWMMISAKCMPE